MIFYKIFFQGKYMFPNQITQDFCDFVNQRTLYEKWKNVEKRN